MSADDPELFSSQNEQDNRHYARFAKIPMLEPSTSQEAKDYMIEAIGISERFETPVVRDLDPDSMTPRQALEVLYELHRKAGGRKGVDRG